MDETFDLKQRTINLAVKAYTKKELDKIGSRKDSYDDIIRLLIKEHYANEILNKDSQERNQISISEYEQKDSSVKLDSKTIYFKFNMPSTPISWHYSFDVFYTKIIKEGKECGPTERYAEPKEMATDYLRVVEKLIQSYIDPLFKIRKQNRSLFDLDWWERNFRNLNLSYESFNRDIKERLLSFGILI